MTRPLPRGAAVALTAGLALGAALAGCSSEASLEPPTTMSRAVTQGGPQDIAFFRAVVERGGVPDPETLEPVGFFAEHAVDLPAADCGETICVHPMLAVAPRFDGTEWTMAYVTMNSPVDPATLPRPDTHVVLALETSRRTEAAQRVYSRAIGDLARELREGDLISVVTFSSAARVEVEAAAPTDSALQEAVPSGLDDEAALYDGLARAGQLALGSGMASRVIVVSSGVVMGGLEDTSRIEGLAADLGRAGVPVTAIGFAQGAETGVYDARLVSRIAESGGGSYYFSPGVSDLLTVFALEGRTALFPLATDFELVVEAAEGYEIGRIYGARRAAVLGREAQLSSPLLSLGHRTGASDVADGRRGGGGGLFVELRADAARGASIGAGQPAFHVRARWTDSATGGAVTYSTTVINEMAPGEVPSGMWPYFSDAARGKAFMMLNMYIALQFQLDRYQASDCAGALGVEDAMGMSVDGWQQEYDDPDIDADWALLGRLTENLRQRCGPVTPQPPDRRFSGSCMFW